MKYSYVNRKCELEDFNFDLPSEEISEGVHSPLMLVYKTPHLAESLSSSIVHSDDIGGEIYEESGEELHSDQHGEEPSSLVMYFKTIHRIPLLSEAEERGLAKRIKDSETECKHLVIQWQHLFKNEFLGMFSATRKKKIRDILQLRNGSFHLFDDLVQLERERKKIIRALKRQAPGFKTHERFQEELYKVEAEISKCMANISLSKSINNRLIKNLKRVPHSKKDAEKRQSVEQELRSILKETGELSEEIKELKKELVHANQRLVICIAKKYAHHDLTLPDLIQEGNLGLIRAIDTYDYRRGHRFITYATWWIRQAIIRALDCQSRTIRTPVHINEKFKKITKISHQLLQEYKGKPSLENIAKETNTPLESIEKVIKCFNDTISLDTCIDKGGNDVTTPPLGYPMLSTLGKVISSDLSQHIDLMLSDLTLREREIVKLRFGIGVIHDHTLEEIGEKFHLSRERIRQILERALDKLRNPKHMIQLKDFVDFN